MTLFNNGFRITEFVPKQIFDRFGANAWWLIDPKVPRICAEIKADFGGAQVIINNWYAGGVRQFSGYRPISCKTGGNDSQHRHGRAADVLVAGHTADAVRDHILAQKEKYIALGLTTLEHKAFAPTWVHFDVRFTGMNEILIVKPMK